MGDTTIRARLEYLRGEIEAERISLAEIAELQGFADHIAPGDVQLLEWAGVEERAAYASREQRALLRLTQYGVLAGEIDQDAREILDDWILAR